MKILKIKVGFLVVAIGLLLATLSYGQDHEMHHPKKALGGKEGVGYVVMNDSNTIAVIDIAANKVVGVIPIKGNPHGGVITPDGKYIYTASMGSSKNFVVDIQARRVVNSIDVGGISHHSTITPDGRYVYVAAEQLVVIDTITDKVIARIDTEEPPFYPEWTPDGRLLYVLNMGSTITVIDPSTNKVIDTIKMGGNSVMGHLAFNPSGSELYATNDEDNIVSVIDTSLRKNVATVKVGEGPHGVATTRDGKYVYVANKGGTTFSVIEASSKRVIATHEVGEQPEHFSLTPDGKYIFLSINTGSDKLLVIDPPTFRVIKEIHVWPEPHAFFFFQPSSTVK